MKITEFFDQLFESPLNLNKEAPPIFSIDYATVSTANMERGFESLGTHSYDGILYTFWFNGSRAMVTTPDLTDQVKDLDGNQRNEICVDLRAKECSIEIPLTKLIQVDTVSTNSQHRRKMLAGILYIVLARYGYNVVSDFEQYAGGIGLWKLLAQQSTLRNFAVRVWDIDNKTWILDSNGDPVKYNARNLASEQVWHTISNQTSNTVLVLSGA